MGFQVRSLLPIAFEVSNFENYYIHQLVNHSIAFRDPVTGFDTNTIEGFYNALKYKIALYNRINSIYECENLVENIPNDY
ncbi:hypothetical protein HZS_828 [Henneguya salminicola]|nr:hypothetical protein HZS_828 [Henneguya salminicola]